MVIIRLINLFIRISILKMAKKDFFRKVENSCWSFRGLKMKNLTKFSNKTFEIANEKNSEFLLWWKGKKEDCVFAGKKV